MTSRALGQVRKSSALSHTFPKRGSGAMGSRFREQLTNWTDLAVFTQPDQWKGFLSTMVTAHEAGVLYMSNFLEEITKNKYNQGRLTLKDLKPDTFESSEKSKVSFRRWSDEFSQWVERIDQELEKMLRLAAQMQQWDKDKFRHFQDSRRRLVPTHQPAVREERARLDRHCQSTPRVEATHLDCGIFPLAERDQEVGQRVCRQSPQETMPNAIVQAAYIKVVPEAHRRAMETQVDVDQVDPHNLESKALAFIGNTTSDAAPMDIGSIAPGHTPAVPVRVPRQVHTDGRTVIQI